MANKKGQLPAIPKSGAVSEEMVFDESIYSRVREILEAARSRVHNALSREMITAYWSIGKEIFEQTGDRAEYGAFVVDNTSHRLTRDFGSGFSRRNVFYMRKVYEAFPNSANAFALLSWSHLRVLAGIERPDIRELYIKECVEEKWSVKQLERQVQSLKGQRLHHKRGIRRAAGGATFYDTGGGSGFAR